MFEYLIYKLIMLVSLTFPLRFTYWVALRVADLHYLCDRGARERVKKNLRRILGPGAPEAKVIYEARWTFRHFGKYLGEFFRFAKFDESFLKKYVSVKGIGHVDLALKEGRGCILLSAHFANWELGGCILGLMGYTTNVIVREHANPLVNRLFRRQRERKGLKLFSPGSAVRSSFEALARNEILAIAGDRDFSGKGVEAVFFGAKAVFPRGPAHFALRTGAPVIPVFVHRRSNDAFIFRFHPPLTIDPARSRDEQVRQIVEPFVRLCEDTIARDPSLWCVFDDFWGGPMWKERPLSTFRRKTVDRDPW